MKSAKTPMMQQYLSIKAQHKDSVLFFRLGDFYEMFNDDAVEVSRLLNLTLTQRTGQPMCGIPYHASKIYIARLLRAGKKIAICEQTSSPVPGELTERKVVEIITPGTATEEDFLDQGQNNYLAALYCTPKPITADSITDYFIGFSYIDNSTGEFFALSFPASSFAENLKKELGRVQPREILIQQKLTKQFPLLATVCSEYPAMVQNFYPDWAFHPGTAEKRLCACFKTETLTSFGINLRSPELPPAGLLLEYLEQTAGAALSHITGIKLYRDSDFVIMDDATRKNLELTQNLRDAAGTYTLFEVLCHTKTAMGTRLLRQWIHYPLCRESEITRRLLKTQALYQNRKYLQAVRSALSEVFDIHRLAGRVAMHRASGKDMIALKKSLYACSGLHRFSQEHGLFFTFSGEAAACLEQLYELLEKSINEDCPLAVSGGGVIKTGWSEHLDSLRNIQQNAAGLLENYLAEERKKTGITNLKIKYNRLMGYFLEVTKGNLSSVPKHFIPRRSLANAERFVTQELQDLEEQLTTAGDKIIACEKELFAEVLKQVQDNIHFLTNVAQDIAALDAVQSFAQCALQNSWVKPEFSQDGCMEITNGRHPVVEAHLPSGEFVANSIMLSSDDDAQIPAFALITGPNMAGKSTFLRQTALIVLLAQIGSFVPAEQLRLTPVDRIFCRVGATDNLARGESTFLVEMTETAYILRNATKKSLVIMDEVGRGTSTADGLSIASAITEYLLDSIGAKTLFATHYHELAQLEHPRLQNLCLDVLEAEGTVVFLKKVIHGSAAHSYGIHVAKLAGLPASVLQRAAALQYTALKQKQLLEETTASVPAAAPAPARPHIQNLFSDEELIINEILSLNLDTMTPLEALHIIHSWKKTLNAGRL